MKIIRFVKANEAKHWQLHVAPSLISVGLLISIKHVLELQSRCTCMFGIWLCLIHFYAPASIDRGHIVLGMPFCPFVCQQKLLQWLIAFER